MCMLSLEKYWLSIEWMLRRVYCPDPVSLSLGAVASVTPAAGSIGGKEYSFEFLHWLALGP